MLAAHWRRRSTGNKELDMTTPSEFSQRLLDLDERSTDDRAQFVDRARELFDRPLTPRDWFWMLVMGGGGLAGATVCGLLAATEPAGMPALTRAVLAVLACVGLFWAAFSGFIIRRGAINSAVHGAIAAKLGFLFSLAAAVLIGAMSLAGVGGAPSAGLALLPIVPLVLSSVVLIAREVRQAELRLQQRLLEIEYRLARLTADAVQGHDEI
jgi:hypothetical protein